METMTKKEVLRREFGKDFCGSSSVFYALKDILEGRSKTEKFFVADHPNSFFSEVYESIVIGRAEIDGVLCWRFCGERDLPDSNGSHALCASWDDQSLALACANLSAYLSMLCEKNKSEIRKPWIFRQ